MSFPSSFIFESPVVLPRTNYSSHGILCEKKYQLSRIHTEFTTQISEVVEDTHRTTTLAAGLGFGTIYDGVNARWLKQTTTIDNRKDASGSAIV